MNKKKADISLEKKNPDYSQPDEQKCSFCGEIPSEDSTMITAPNNVFICEKCALTCTAMFYDMNPEKWYNDLMYIIERIDEKNAKLKKPAKNSHKR